jgi:hypothetical protein
VTVNHGTEDGPLRSLLKETAAEHGLSMSDLTVLAEQNDPFRMDTPAGHRVGAWLAMHVERLFPDGKRFHLRGLHYKLMTDKTKKPNGKQYLNIEKDWQWLQDVAADAARWLGYIPFDRIFDKRNAAPVIRSYQPGSPHHYVTRGLDLEDITPSVDIDNFVGVQPYRLVLFGEKSSLEDVLDPSRTATRPAGRCPSRSAGSSKRSRRSCSLTSTSACTGWRSPTSKSGPMTLPSTPLKKEDKRAERWQEAWGIEQTEIDALATLQPDRLRQLATDAIAPFYDQTLDQRVYRAKVAWLEEAQAAFEQHLGHEELDRIEEDVAPHLDRIRAEVEAINDAVSGITLAGVDLPDVEVPEAEADEDHGTPLVDSEWDFAEQCQALIESKAYTTSDQEDQP